MSLSVPFSREAALDRAIPRQKSVYLPGCPILQREAKRLPRAWLRLLTSLSILFFIISLWSHASPLNIVAIYLLFAVGVLLLMFGSDTRHNPLHPLSLLIVFLLLNYGFRALEIIFLDLPVQNVLNPQLYISKACVLMTTFLVLVFAGYHFPGMGKFIRKIPLLAFPVVKSRMPSILVRTLGLFGLAIILQLLMPSWGATHYHTTEIFEHNGAFSIAHEFSRYAKITFIALLPMFWARKISWFLIPSMLGAILVGALVSGGAGGVISPFIYIAVIYWYCRKPLSWPKYLSGWLILIFLAAPLAYAWRNAYSQKALQGQANITSSLSAMDQLAGNQSLYLNSTANVLGRFGALDQLILTLKMVPSHFPYQWGKTFLPYVEQLFIPRLLNPNKNIVNITVWFNHKFLGMDSQSSISLGFVGETYFNFGYWGILLSIPFGMILRFLWERLVVYSRIEAFWSWRFYFVVFSVFLSYNGALIYQISNMTRGALELLFVMMVIYGQLPLPLSWTQAQAMGSSSLSSSL